jgi:ankyrin repeat protein
MLLLTDTFKYIKSFFCKSKIDINEVEFINACIDGNIEIVKQYFSLYGKEIFNIYDDDDESGLIKSIKEGHTDIFLFLLDNGMNVNDVYGEFDYTPLITACDCLNYDMAKELINRGADVNVVALNLLTPLKIACIDMNYRLVKLLLLKGANRICSGTRDGHCVCKKCEPKEMNCFNIDMIFYYKEHSIYGTPILVLKKEYKKEVKKLEKYSFEYDQLYLRYKKTMNALLN